MISRRQLLIGSAVVPVLSYLDLTQAFADTPKDILVVAQQLDNITTLDPHANYEALAGEICTNLYQNLVVPDPEDASNIQPVIAESWSVDDSGKVFTFKLADQTFSTGNPVTAEDVAYSLQRAIKINGGAAFIIGQFGFTPDNVDQTIVAVDDKTVTLTTAEPTAISFLLYCLSASVGAIVEKAVVEAHVEGDDMGKGWLNKNSAGSGPFVLQVWKPSEAISLTVNAHGPYTGDIKRILVRHVADPSSQLLMLQKGDVDIARNLTSEQLTQVEGVDGFNMIRQEVAALMLISLNQDNEYLSKPEVWQAIKWALDYEGMQKNIVPMTYAVHQSFEPSGIPGAVSENPFHQDIDKAKALMEKAGLADGFEITMDHYSNQPYPDIAQAVQASLGQIGIKVNLLAGENRQVLTKMRARQHQMAMSSWGTDYFDPNANAEVFCINEDNSDDAKDRPFIWRSHFQNADFAARAKAARDEKDPATRLEMYESLQRDYMQNSPFAFMFQKTDTAVCRTDVHGFRLQVFSSSNTYQETTKS
ncbi:ABC transporter substrate-binding protein [Martelella lutilitoris]|uniref:ABC transporter substrate-binding protein n=1 Tax=Martelella lutilitoris TaxID=2583532 RepID=A0A5C4JM59_9HYPH|nr:ABC transporter substrate-binding protein [Martelella lutilitoris]TNB46271.1 ABC transporter substrate-binding protein [Martelella lutilitoris]